MRSQSPVGFDVHWNAMGETEQAEQVISGLNRLSALMFIGTK